MRAARAGLRVELLSLGESLQANSDWAQGGIIYDTNPDPAQLTRAVRPLAHNGHDIMVVKAKGEFVWHSHADTDDFFLVLKGELDIELLGHDGPADAEEASAAAACRSPPRTPSGGAAS